MYQQHKPYPLFQVHHSDGTYEYNYSWRNGQGKLTGGGAASYCRGLGSGWTPVAIESPQKNSFIYNLIRSGKFCLILSYSFSRFAVKYSDVLH